MFSRYVSFKEIERLKIISFNDKKHRESITYAFSINEGHVK